MIGTLAYLPASSGQEREFQLGESLSGADKERLADMANVLFDLLSPLAQMTYRIALDDLLRGRVSWFRQLNAEAEELLWTSLPQRKEQSRELYNYMRKAITIKADLLGEAALEQLLGAIDSSEGFNNCIIKTLERGDSGVYRLTSISHQAGKAPLYADMCLGALMGIITDHINCWFPEAIPVLVEAADDYMTEVEDLFLAESVADIESNETVGYESLRKDLGL